MRHEFVPGVDVARSLAGVIEPRLRVMFPQLSLALAFIGPGSDVAGYDTERSMDHDWGPRLTIVVPESACNDVAARIDADINDVLPANIAGFPARFSLHADGTTFPDESGTIHRLRVTSVQRILGGTLGIDDQIDLTPAVWLSTPMQSLLEITSGQVFVDDTGELNAMRAILGFYPMDILRYQLAALWMRVSQVQPFVGRAGEVGDEAGSATIAAGLVRDLMRIGLLQSGQYAPYAKWLGTAFANTKIGSVVLPDLTTSLHATAWHDREAGLNRAGSHLVRHLNGLALARPVPEAAVPFHTRPFQVLPAEEIAHALQASLADTRLARLPSFVGGIDIVTDSTDALKSPPFRVAFQTMLQSLLH